MVKTFKNTGYWALILGGSSGLGLGTAKELARRGMNLCIVYRSARTNQDEIAQKFKELEQLGIKLQAFNLDALKPENIKLVLQNLEEVMMPNDKIRVLVHSIAKGHVKPLASKDNNVLSAQDYGITLHAMATSLVDWVHAVFANKLFAPDARIISFTSQGSSKPMKHYAAVSAAKSAIEAINRSIALEYAPYGIRANCIQAGITDTASLRIIPKVEQLLERAKKNNPHRRTTTPEDVAKVVYLLCKDEAAWITGCTIPVDGGEHLL